LFTKVKSDTLRTRIAQQIRDAILGGTLKEGSKLVERNLASELGASLTAVREGLIELEWEGFIVKKKMSGTHVVKLGLKDVEKIFRVREVLEALAFAEAASNATGSVIAELEKGYTEMMDAARNKDARLYNQKDMAWHQSVWQASNNEFLVAALRRAVLPYFSYTAIRIGSVDPFVLYNDAAEHYPLLEAIRAHDRENARRIFTEKIQSWLALARVELSAGRQTLESAEVK
jgi:DNA-binding GntR family transcriptional regulator